MTEIHKQETFSLLSKLAALVKLLIIAINGELGVNQKTVSSNPKYDKIQILIPKCYEVPNEFLLNVQKLALHQNQIISYPHYI